MYDKSTGRLVATSATAAVHTPKDGHEQQVEVGPALQGAVDVSAADGSTLFVADGKTSAITVMRLLVTDQHKAPTNSSSSTSTSNSGGDASAVVQMEVEDRG